MKLVYNISRNVWKTLILYPADAYAYINNEAFKFLSYLGFGFCIDSLFWAYQFVSGQLVFADQLVVAASLVLVSCCK